LKILSYNPGHDGAFAYIEEGRLVFSIEAEKGSRYRHSSLSVPDAFDALAELCAVPDVLCKGGWWPGDATTPYPAFYSYASPEPAGFGDGPVRPAAAFYDRDAGQFRLKYDDVRTAASPREALLAFCQSTYDAAAGLANWTRGELER